MKRKTIDIITLGCSKNLVDSEHLMRQLEEVGFHVTHDAERPKGQIAVINTCGFIGDAKEESINMILEFAQAKEEGNLEKLYVMGCLSERYLKELAVEIPQVDKFYGKFNWRELLQDLGKAYHDELHIERTLTTPKHYAYLKISEGCDRNCSISLYVSSFVTWRRIFCSILSLICCRAISIYLHTLSRSRITRNKSAGKCAG